MRKFLEGKVQNKFCVLFFVGQQVFAIVRHTCVSSLSPFGNKVHQCIVAELFCLSSVYAVVFNYKKQEQ